MKLRLDERLGERVTGIEGQESMISDETFSFTTVK